MTPKLTEYELERLERIAQNEARMAALALPTLAAAIAPAKRQAGAKPIQRGLASKRKRHIDDKLPPRRSSRLQGSVADGVHVLSEIAGAITTTGGAAEGALDTAPKERHPKGDVPFVSKNNAGPATDAAFLQLLRPSTPSNARTKARSGLKELMRMSLREEDVSKVVKSSVTHLAFMPTSGALILAVADKKGGVGLWHVDRDLQQPRSDASSAQKLSRRPPSRSSRRRNAPTAADDAAAESDAAEEGDLDSGAADEQDSEAQGGGADGVLVFTPHHEYVSGLRWAAGSLFTASYDGSLRRLDAERAAFLLAWGDEEKEYSCMDLSPDAATAYLGDKDGNLDVIDLRAGKRANASLSLHARKLNTLHLDPGGGHLAATSSTDGKVCLWDVRKLAARRPVAAAQHLKGSQAAYLCPDGSARVASTSFDDTVRVWDGRRGMAQLASIRHDNRTGRWVLPFRAVWAPAGDALVIGNMQRYVDVLDVSSGTVAAQLRGDAMTAIAPRHCMHPTLPMLAAGTASGRLHIYR